MRPSGRSYTCSWEIPYDFTPRIHRYPGVDRGIVREAWESRPEQQQQQRRQTESQESPPPPAPPRRRRRIQWKAPQSNRPPGAPRQHQRWRRGVQAPVLAGGGRQGLPRTSRTPNTRQTRPPSPPPTNPPSAGTGVGGPHTASPRRPRGPRQPRPPPPPVEQTDPHPMDHHTEGQQGGPAVVLVEPRRPTSQPPSASPALAPTAAAAAAAVPPDSVARRRSPLRPPPRRYHRPHSAGSTAEEQVRRYTAEDIAQLLRSASISHAPQAAAAAGPGGEEPAATPKRTRHRYAPRTMLAYTLPPQHSQWRRWLRTHRSLPIAYVDSYAVRHAPPALHTAFLPRQRSQRMTTHTRQVLTDALDRAAPFSTADLVETTTATTTAQDGNYNANALDVYTTAHNARLAAFAAREERIYDRLVGGVVPMEEVLAVGVDGATRTLDCVAVLDSGRIADPIIVTNGGGEGTGQLQSPPPPIPVEQGSVAVLVRPVDAELSSFDAAPAFLPPRKPLSMLPRGREWDRQRAIQAAVGTTAQEALIDLRIDPRYRQPGEYVRWRHDGRQRRAVK